MSENITDSCYTANALPRGPGYTFRVSYSTKTGLAPFSDPSPPAFMATPYEGIKIQGKSRLSGILDTDWSIKACFVFCRLSHSSHSGGIYWVKDHGTRRSRH